MAWQRILTKGINGYNVNLGIDYDDSSFTTTSVRCRTVIEKTSSVWYDDRFACNGGIFSNWQCKPDGTGSGSWPYYAEFTLGKANTASSYSTGDFNCACTGNATYWGNIQGGSETYCGNAIIGAPLYAIVTVPSVSHVSTSNITRTSAHVSFTSSANGQSPYSPYIDLGTYNFGNVIKTINAKSGTFNDLTPNTTYYVRANDANDAGRGYSTVGIFKTLGNAPDITNVYTESLNRTSCILNFDVIYDTNDSLNNYTIYYGTTTDYGNETSDRNISNLTPNTTYYYKLSVLSTQNRRNEYIGSFTTLGNPPEVANVEVLEVKSKSITIETSYTLDTNASLNKITYDVYLGSELVSTVDSLSDIIVLTQNLKPGKLYTIKATITDNFDRKSSEYNVNVKTKGGFKFNGKMSDSIKINGKEVVGMKYNGIEII